MHEGMRKKGAIPSILLREAGSTKFALLVLFLSFCLLACLPPCLHVCAGLYVCVFMSVSDWLYHFPLSALLLRHNARSRFFSPVFPSPTPWQVKSLLITPLFSVEKIPHSNSRDPRIMQILHFLFVTTSLPGRPVSTHKPATAITSGSRTFSFRLGVCFILTSLHLMRSFVRLLHSSLLRIQLHVCVHSNLHVLKILPCA